jgi:transcriptional regulator with XRE-family HTH domain
LRLWREEAGLTQRELAKRLRELPSYVHKSETGERRLDALEFAKWCRACDLDPSRAILVAEKA